MKKLMMAVGAVAFAATVQAATATWNFQVNSVSYAGNSTTIAAGATAYMICYSSEYESGEFGISQADLLAGLQSGKNVSTVAGTYMIGSTTVGADGKIAANNVTFDDSFIEDDYVGAYLVLVSGEKAYLGEENWFGIDPLTSNGLFDPQTGNTKYTIDSTGEAYYSDPGWYSTQSVPEPTSGLLLLLGMAGLALKRKRA